MHKRIRALALAMVAVGAATVGAEAAAEPASRDGVFATVGDQVITGEEYVAALREGVRAKYYHGTVPEHELAAYPRAVGRQLIDHTLLLVEARQRGIEPDSAWVAQRLESYERRYRHHPQWAEQRESLRSILTARLEQRSVLERLESQVRDIAAPTDRELRAFYESNPDPFTEPERIRLSIILLAVDPSAAAPTWQAALEEARTLLRQIRTGADFSELARLHSGDRSAAEGGDMGYLHYGMLGKPAQEAVDGLAVGELTEPVHLLEGIALFRLEDRQPPSLNAFDAVRDRARELWLRGKSDATWKRFVAGLRSATAVDVNETYYDILQGGSRHGGDAP